MTVRVETETPAYFGLELRIPGWCAEPTLNVNDQSVTLAVDVCGFVRLERDWQTGDVLSLRFPMRLQSIPRAKGAVGLALGPLVLALSVPEIWERIPDSTGFGDWEVRPRKS